MPVCENAYRMCVLAMKYNYYSLLHFMNLYPF